MKNKGFTLIELIISITLISFLILIVTVFLFRIISFLESEIFLYPSKTVNILKLNQTIESIFTYISKNRNSYDIFFKGYSKKCSFISYFNPFENSFGPVEVSIFLEKNCLLLSYFQIYSKSVDYLNVKNFVSKPRTVKLFCNVKDINFEYMIFDSKEKKFKFVRVINNKLPDYIKLNITWDSNKISSYLFKVMSFDVEKKSLTQSLLNNSIL
jgi:prepilin-type N-terminal cleavage/methylation domain-containing protein